MDIETLKKQINDNKIKPVYFLYGKEDYLIQKTVNLIKKKTVSKGFENFNMQVFDGGSFSYNDFETAYEALPMMAEYKCVLLKDVNLDKISKGDYEKFLKLLSDVNTSTVLVIYFVGVKIDVKKNAKYKKIIEAVNKVGSSCEFDFANPSDLRKTITEYCYRKKCPIDKKAVDRLVEQTAKGYAVILNELDKLVAYANGKPITVDDVKKLCISSIDNDAFDLSNAILQNRYDSAFLILDRLFYLKVEPIQVMGAINMSFIDMYRIKTAQTVGLSSQDVIKDFKYRSSYRITKLYSTVSKYSISQIRSLIKILEKTDTLLKSSQLDNKLIMEEMIGKMMLIASKRRMI